MAETLHVSQNAYCLIEKGVTRLIDSERIKLIAEKLEVKPIELGLFEGLGIEQHADNHELIFSLEKEVEIKNHQIEQLLNQNKQLLAKLLNK